MSSRFALCLVALGFAASLAAAQEAPPAPTKPPKESSSGKGPRIKVGSDPEAPPADSEKPAESAPPKAPQKSEPEQWIELLAQWPAAEAKQASIRLAAEPTVSYPLLEKKLLEPNQDWRMICGVCSTMGKIRDLRAVELVRAKLEDKKMYTHGAELLDALVRIDPVGAKARLFSLLQHPASAVVVEVEKILEPRVAPTDVDALRDAYDAGEKSASAREAALRLLAKADRVASRPDVVKALRDASCDVAFAAASVLAADESPEALELAKKAQVTPIDRQFAYATLSLALRAERGTAPAVDDATVRTLLGPRGVRSLDRLCRASAATLLADEGYFHDAPALDEALDKSVVPALVEDWVAREFWPDMKVVQPMIHRRLRRLTGKLELTTPQEWAAWWEQEGAHFTAKRVLMEVPESSAAGMVLTVEGTGAPGGETTTIAASPENLGATTPDELALLVSPEDAKNLAKTLNESGVLRLAESVASPRDMPNSVGFTIRSGKRERIASARTDSADAGVAKLLAAVTELRSRYAWQRYRTSNNGLDAQSFVAAMSKAFAAERTAEERNASLASLIVSALDDRRGADWNVRALRELESIPHLGNALSPQDSDRLLGALGRRGDLDLVAQGIVRVLAKAEKPEATPHVLDFLASHPSADARTLATFVIQNARRDQFVAELADERPEIRLAAFAAADGTNADDAVIAKLLKAVDDKDRVVAAEAIRALGRLHVEQARPLIEGLAQRETDVRAAAVESLGLLGGRESLNVVMQAYASDDPALRVAAIQALASSREPEGLSAIVFAMSGDPSTLVREVASRVVNDIGGERVGAELRKLAIDPAQPSGPRARAVKSYAQIRGKAATADLSKLVLDPADEVADEAALGLARRREPVAVPRLLTMLEKERSVQSARQALESISLESFPTRDPRQLADLYGGWWELSKDRGPKRWLLDSLTVENGENDAALRAWSEGDAGRQVVPSLLKALRADKWYVRRAADVALTDLLGRKVGDQEPWTTPGDASRMADQWEKVWAETLGN